MITAIMQVSATTYAQKITIDQKNTTLDQVFKQIRQQSGYDFLFDSQLIKKAKPVSIRLTNVSVEDAVKKSLEGQFLTYTISEHTVVIKEKGFIETIKDKLFADPEFITVSGRVTSANSDILSGAVVLIKRTKQGTTTDANGFFMIKMAKPTDTITCSFIGYKTQIVPVNKKYFLDVKLAETTNALDEVVVQAYGQTTQRLTTGSIGRLTAKDIAIQPIMDPLLALEGKVPGLVITPQTGYEGGPVKVEVRGRNSTNTNYTSDPLYIIDGVPLIVMEISKRTGPTAYGNSAVSHGLDQTDMSFSGGQNPLFSMNPGDIESMEVLKDADATAIYGSRGANGVILITTKKGKIGATKLDASISQGLRFVTGYWDMLNTPQYLNMRREAFRNDGVIPTVSNAPDLTVWDQNANTNWQKYAYGGMGHWTNAQSSLSGGTDQYTYRLGAAFNRTTDITTVSGINQRASVSFAFNNHSQNKRFNLGLTTNYSFSEMNQIAISSVSTLAPNAPGAFDSNGNLNYAGWGAQRGFFPFSALLKPYTSKVNYLSANLMLSYALTKGLIIKTSLGYNNSLNDQTYFSPYTSLDPTPLSPSVPAKASATFGNNKTGNWIIEPQLEYSKLIGKGSLNALLGGTLQTTTSSGLLIQGTNYSTDALLNTITAAGNVASSDLFAQYKYTGVFARLGYNWQNKYIINLNGRRDGSSRFGAENQFGNFGSVGAAWIASDEDFIKKVLPKVISFVKLRGSYGLTGSDAVGEYSYLSRYGNPTYVTSGTTIIPTTPTYNGVASIIPLILPNDQFHWQVNKKLEGALDISLFNDKVNFEAAYYRNRCDNQLISFPVPEITGFTSVVANSPANVQNSGYEFTVSANVIDKKDFTWNFGFNIGFNKNVLLSYPNLSQSPFFKLYVVGQSLDNRYVLNYTGVDPLTGQYTYEDHNHDGKVITDEFVAFGTKDDDRYVAINTAPKYSGGFNNQFTYKGITLNTVFTFRKQMGNNALTTIGGTNNASVYQYENRWQYPGQTALMARVTNTPTNSDYLLSSSNAIWTDASFIRLQTVALSYNLPVKLISRIGLKNLSISLNAQNIFVLTKFKGIDPEYQSFGSMPPVRTIVSGLSCSF
ncbi:MAG: SusC/RagA family TonB-linked outer membrane protein [Mucilaginibacter sp.]|uniref:SusC/RagA family TonB-linked outer membrane protein n=1 Tax=Mucilaginibacter sp. TaxID=1882438 RepID=UPI003265635A